MSECKACKKWGDGMIWYKNPRNHGARIYTRPTGRAYDYHGSLDVGLEFSSIDYTFDTIRASYEDQENYHAMLERVNREYYAEREFCTVLSLKDAKEVVHIAWPLAIMHCICRTTTYGRDERSEDEYSCLALGPGMYKWQRYPHNYKGGIKFVSPEEAEKWLEKWDKRGMCHIIMTYSDRAVAGVCNCDYPACWAIRFSLDYGIHYVLKGHQAVQIDYDKCTGCDICAGRCHFRAITKLVAYGEHSAPFIRMDLCAGCGVCVNACPQGALELIERQSVPGLEDNWEVAQNAVTRPALFDIDIKQCTSPFACKKCLEICPHKCFLIEETKVEKGRETPPENWKIDALYRDKCIGCMKCVEVCPEAAIKVTKAEVKIAK